jgi:hypothetical protein
MDRVPTHRLTSFGIGCALAVLLAPAPARAQNAAEVPAEVQQWIQEIQQVQAQLEPLQARALEEEGLKAEQEQVVKALRDQMVAADPENEGRLVRMEAILEEAAIAQQAGDTDKLAELTTEASSLQPQIQAAQQAALAHPSVQPRIAAFQENLHKRIVAIDPAAQGLLDRVAELQARVTDALNDGRI